MKSTGMVRRIDDLGRLIIPKELRRTLGIEDRSPLEFFVDGETIVVRKYEPGCVFCGETSETISLGGKHVCRKCAIQLGILAEEKKG